MAGGVGRQIPGAAGTSYATTSVEWSAALRFRMALPTEVPQATPTVLAAPSGTADKSAMCLASTFARTVALLAWPAPAYSASITVFAAALAAAALEAPAGLMADT